MLFVHPAHPGRAVRLAYCQNLHPADTVEKLLAGLSAIALPLRARLAPGGTFGIGLYVPDELARHLAAPGGERDLYRIAGVCAAEGLDPFTWNAFPFGGFGESGLKAKVFSPTWREPARLDFTRAVARVAILLLRRLREKPGESEHLSISTHTGGFAVDLRGERDLVECALNQARAVDDLARLEEETGVRAILALEPEPRANAGNLAEYDRYAAFGHPLAVELLEDERNRDSARAATLIGRHLGLCLDACHAAVEGDRAQIELAAGTRRGPAKMQYSNALAVRDPRRNEAGVAALLALDEPRYLHQVTGHRDGEPLLASDLPELAAALAGPARESWLDCREWRCHFHVPVDLDRAGGSLSTTRADADALLATLLEDPARWSTPELHVEIETYTWEILPGWARGEGALVDGLEREYRHVLALFDSHGWRRG